MALHQKPDISDAVNRARGFLHATLSGASQKATVTTRMVGVGAYMYRLWKRLSETLVFFHEPATEQDDEQVFREAQLLFLRRRESFHGASTRTEIFKAWNNLLVEATQNIARNKRDSALYAHDAERMDGDDREWYDAMRKHVERS
jgi:hypothetical protein